MGADVLPYFVFTLGRDRLMAEQFTRSPCSVMLWSDLTLYLKPAPVLKLSIGWRRAVSSTLQPMDPGNTASGADWVGGWVGNQDASTRCGEGTPPPPNVPGIKYLGKISSYTQLSELPSFRYELLTCTESVRKRHRDNTLFPSNYKTDVKDVILKSL